MFQAQAVATLRWGTLLRLPGAAFATVMTSNAKHVLVPAGGGRFGAMQTRHAGRALRRGYSFVVGPSARARRGEAGAVPCAGFMLFTLAMP